jgi:4-amino-4-deoxy-L-arabinose transferase-like glycosyltransferase
VALAVRLAHAFLVAADMPIPGDAFLYRLLGYELANGFGYSEAGTFESGHLRPTAEHPPLFPLFLAFLTKLGLGGVGAERVACALLGTLTVGLVGLLGRRVAGDRVGLIAAGVAAIYPPLLLADGALISESLYAPLVVAALLLAFRLVDRPTPASAAALGAVIGLCALTRSDGILLLPLLALPMAWRVSNARWRALAACAAAALIVLAPWLGRNWVQFDRFPLLSTNTGFTALAANCPATYYSSKYIGFARHQCVFRSDCVGIPGELAASDCMRDEARAYARRHLGRVPLVVLARVGRVWELYGADTTYDYGVNWARARWLAEVGRIVSLVALALALAGALALWRRAVPLLPLLAPLLVATLVAVLTFGFSRYRLVAEPSLVVLAAVGADWLWRSRRRLEPREPQPNQVVEHPQGVADPADPRLLDVAPADRDLGDLPAAPVRPDQHLGIEPEPERL